MALKIIFAGTSDFAVPSLRALLASEHQVLAVYTQPDRPAGRGQKLTASPVKELALPYQTPVEQPVSLRDPAAQQQLKNYNADLMIVVAYGLILPQAVLDLFPRGCINVHGSLLPRWRGAAPIHRAILAGDTNTGVTIMQMDAGLDTGPMLRQASIPIAATATSQIIHDQLAQLGAEELLLTLLDLAADKIKPQVQDNKLATYAAKIEKAEAELNWQQSAEELARKIRAFNPWPVTFTHWQNQPLRIWQAEVIQQAVTTVPGTIVQADKNGIQVATSKNILNILRLQLPGGKPIAAADFLNSQHKQIILHQTTFN